MTSSTARRPVAAPVAAPAAEGPPVLAPVVQRALAGLLTLVCLAAALVSAFAYSSGDKKMMVLPLAAVVGVVLGVLALTRFSGFVLMLLAVRPSLDLVKLSGASAGTTEGNTAAGRGMDPSSLLAILFLLAALLWLAARHYSGRSVPVSRLGIAWCCFVVACILSVLSSAHRQASGLEAMRISTVVMMFVVLEQMIDSEAVMKRVIAACYAGLAFPLVYTLVRILIGNPPSEAKGSFSRLTGPFSQSNTFSRYLGFMIIFGLAIYPHLGRRTRRWMLATLGISMVFLGMTLTRTAIFAVVAGVIVLAVVQRRKGLILGLVGLSLVGTLLLPGLGARLGTLSAPDAAGSGNTLEWRVRYWTEVLPLANRNPITGIGLNATQYNTDAAKQPHNDFIRAYVETGGVGLLAFGATQLALMANGLAAVRAAGRKTFGGGVGAGALACSVGFFMACIAANVMSNVVSLWYLVAFSACAAAATRLAKARKAGAPPPSSSGHARRQTADSSR